jgi:hypothetical protein
LKVYDLSPRHAPELLRQFAPGVQRRNYRPKALFVQAAHELEQLLLSASDPQLWDRIKDRVH